MAHRHGGPREGTDVPTRGRRAASAPADSAALTAGFRQPGTGGRTRGGARGGNGFGRSMRAFEHMVREDMRVSVRVSNLETGAPLLRVDDYVVSQIGSLGRILLLIEAADHCERGDNPQIVRESADLADGPGIWQHLERDTLSLADAAALLAGSGDHTAGNALLRAFGLDNIAARAESLHLRNTVLRDGLSRRADSGTRAAVSRSTMTELSELIWRLERGEIVNPEVSARVLRWLGSGSYPGSVVGALGLDPGLRGGVRFGIGGYALASRELGLRAETGVVRGPSASVCFAIKVSFRETDATSGFAVQQGLRELGLELLDFVS
ncbi:class A beta-lactamase-related serine hydrolase [Mycetocola sp. BIGb0189]|uniref:class A beta-lactamase-related serine hydrolase n=1 Tax=Mycetocola sp. BIGb0189 TaxID=2940604 RepID=UPI0021685238|nr:class A beta-lactamase-related serine hydrolase [Mycetocola sp. BIGb0189]